MLGVALIGTTITPIIQFYVAFGVVDRGNRAGLIRVSASTTL